MTSRFAAFDQTVEEQQAALISELQSYCAIPCITGQGIGVRESAELTAEVLRAHGIAATVLETGGAPVVYGEVGHGERTLLIYDHYDVQPPEPLELWESGPFAGEIRDGKMFARGVADNRGDAMARAQAIAIYQQTVGPLPIKVKFLIEGEEEIGSPNLPEFVEQHAERLRADGCLWEAGGRDEHDRVQIALGLKGVLHLELRVQAAAIDLHSSLATIVPNAAWRLVWALSTLKDASDTITIDGLMDHVFTPTNEQLEALSSIPFAEDRMKDELRIDGFNQGLTGIDLLRKHLFQPTCTIQGLLSGYTGVGLKAVSPCEAMAKIEFRLVPNLEPELVLDLLRKHLDSRGFEDIEIVVHAQLSPAQADPRSSIARAAIDAFADLEPEAPIVYPWMAGSGPMSYFSAGLGLPVVSTGGISWHGCQVHAPNESIRIKDYLTGIKYIGRLIDRFASS